MSTLYALLPPLNQFDPLEDVQRRLVRGDVMQAGARDELAAGGTFQWPGTQLPVAALVRQQLAGDAGDAMWLCADLACVEADMAAARVLACGDMDLPAEEAEALAEVVSPLLGDSGMHLQTTTPTRWHLRLAHGSPVPDLDSPNQILGDNLMHHLPAGDAGKRWRQLLNELQIVLHQHPLNKARVQHGQPAANSLWLWGGGSLPAWVKSDLQQVYSDDVLVTALAGQAGVPCAASTALDAGTALRGDTLLDLGRAATAPACADLVFGLLDRRRADALVLHFRSGERWRITRGQRWRFWRRAR